MCGQQALDDRCNGSTDTSAQARSLAPGEPDEPQARCYFTEQASTPWTKYRWNAKNTINGTISDKKAPGASTSKCAENCRTSCCSATVMGFVSFVEKISATSRSFHTHMNWKMASDAIAGRPSGRITL